MSQSFEGRVALVTGAASGIGRATAELIAERGAAVCVADRVAQRAAVIATGVEQRGGPRPRPRGRRRRRVSQSGHGGRRPDGVRSAGPRLPQRRRRDADSPPVGEMPVEDWDQIINVDVRGAFLEFSACARPTSQSDAGAVVLTSSLSELRANPGTAAYMSAKHAFIRLTKAAAAEFAPAGVQVNAVCPGLVPTKIFGGFGGEVGERTDALNARFSAAIPLGRAGTAEEMAKLVGFLLSDEASYSTGAALEADGGLSFSTALTRMVQRAR